MMKLTLIIALAFVLAYCSCANGFAIEDDKVCPGYMPGGSCAECCLKSQFDAGYRAPVENQAHPSRCLCFKKVTEEEYMAWMESKKN